ncbi:hypothetical protein L1887_61483 [Cichorium endivia]|nr:hypothetical protein L1887_61483 [Cichorium endivia]
MTSATLGKGRAERTVSNAKQGAFEQTFCGLCKSVCRRGPEMQMTEAEIDVRAQRVYSNAQNDLTQVRHRPRRSNRDSHAEASEWRAAWQMPTSGRTRTVDMKRGQRVKSGASGHPRQSRSDVKYSGKPGKKENKNTLDKPRAGFGWTLFGSTRPSHRVRVCCSISLSEPQPVNDFFRRTRPYSRRPRSSSRSCRGERVVHRIGSPDTDVTDDKKPPVSA